MKSLPNATQYLCAATLWLTASCLASSPKPPPGYTPLDPTNQAAPPAATQGDKYPETINVVDGHDSQGNYDWADGQGYIHEPIMTVWTAMQQPKVLAQYRRLDSSVITATGTDPEADFSFHVHDSTAGGIVVWDLDDRQLHLSGTPVNPKAVIVRDDVIQMTSFIALSSDSIVLTAIDVKTTGYAAIRHQNTIETGPSDASQYITDIFNQVVAEAHGQPLPCYSNCH